MSIYKNSFLHIISFKTYYRSASGNWYYTTDLRQGRKYRFRFRVQNQWSAHLSDWASISYTKIRIWSHAYPNFQFYKTSSFSGGWSNKFQIEGGDSWLKKDKTTTLYAYFKWTGPLMAIAGMQPVPNIGMSATEIRGMKNWPMARLRPNVV